MNTNNTNNSHNTNDYANLGISQSQFEQYIKTAATSVIVESIIYSNNPKLICMEILDDKLATRHFKRIANDILGRIDRE